MLTGFGAEFRRIVLIVIIALAIGLPLDCTGLTLFVGSLVYIYLSYKQMARLQHWLGHTDLAPPESDGLWGSVFDNIYQLQRRQRLEKEELQAVIKRIQEITSALRDGVIILDYRGHLDFWNPAAHRCASKRCARTSRHERARRRARGRGGRDRRAGAARQRNAACPR